MCEKDAIPSLATILYRYWLLLRRELLVIILVEGSSGRETPEPPQSQTGRGQQDVISLTVAPFLAGSVGNWRAHDLSKGLGRQALVPGDALTVDAV